ncbi:phosphonate C-P lyase system protein PhnG [Cobetia sp. L2A1]|uniref:phosphonate C-P lyase system protein PhnG n=1 Tax=Cobetia sp. L2A1 TaxID=2686360 RepID=UPI00131B7DBA|nr:phosphonate C-P lyase system protein PhnG [Cobetia sp. L2A1]
MTPDSSLSELVTPAQRHRVLALTPLAHLRECWARLDITVSHRCVRGPDIGMAMVRGRMGGSGNAFNLGEMTLTRVSVALDDGTSSGGTLGHGWIAGRDREHAELIAVIDACAREARWSRQIDDALIAPLTQRLAAEHDAQSQQAAATRVDFFTLVRGE